MCKVSKTDSIPHSFLLLCSEANAAGPVEEQVRAAIPTKVERLYGDSFMMGAPRPGQGRRQPAPINVVDAFRDFG